MNKCNVLAICDKPEDRRELESCFSYAKDYQSRVVGSREEALMVLNGDPAYNLTVIYLQATPTAGQEMLREIKKKFRDHKVMVITADRRQTLEIMIRGAMDIVFAPFDKFDLLHRIDDLMKDQRSCKRFELKDCDIKIILLNQDGVRLRGLVNNICLDGILIEIDDLEKAQEFFKGQDTVDVLFQPAADEPLVKIFRGNVVRIFKDRNQKGEMAIYLTPERDIDFLDDFVSYFKMNLEPPSGSE